MDTPHQPPTMQETGRLRGPRISQKYAAMVVGVVLLAVVSMAFFLSWSSSSSAERALRQPAKSASKAPVVDERTSKELGRRLESDARQSIQADAAAEQQQGTGLYGLRSLFGARIQPGAATPNYQAPYYQPPSYAAPAAQNQAATRKAEAKRAAEELEERAYRASKASSLVAGFDEKSVARETVRAAPVPIEKAHLVTPAIAKQAPTVEQSKVQAYTLYEGTIIDTVLINGLNAAFAGPLKTQVTTDVPSKDRTAILIKAGSEFIGEAHRISEVGQERVAIIMKRLLRQDGFSMEFDEMPGLSQGGETGLKDKVNHHYLRTFTVTAAMGALGGLAMVNSSGGYGYGYGDASEDFQRGFVSSMGRSATRILDFFVRLPWDVTIRPGWRVEIFMMKDVELPAQEKL